MTRLLKTLPMLRIIGKAPEPPRGPRVEVIREANARQDMADAEGWVMGAMWGLPGETPEISKNAFEREDQAAERQAKEEAARRKNAREDAQIEALRRGGRWRTLDEVLADASVSADREARAAEARERREFQKWREQR